MKVRPVSRPLRSIAFSTLRRLPLTLPSLTDPSSVIVKKSAKFVAIGFGFLLLIVALIPTCRSFALTYWENLIGLGTLTEQLLDGLLGFILLWSAAYSTGIAAVEVLLRAKKFIER